MHICHQPGPTGAAIYLGLVPCVAETPVLLSWSPPLASAAAPPLRLGVPVTVGKVGGREGGREGGKEGGREGGREGGMEVGRERWRVLECYDIAGTHFL